jgi:Fic-DOC domain mobile mystery protein B
VIEGRHLEGQTPIDDVSGLRIRVRSKAELNTAEALNIGKAYVRYFAGAPSSKLAPFTYEWLLELHAEMLGDVWRWAGALRTHETNLGAKPPEIGIQLREMLEDLKAWRESSMPVDEQAARLHHRAVQIHPFANGNGRWSRMLANVWLRLHGEPLVEWPEATVGSASEIRGAYLAAIRKADQGDYAPLLTLHRTYAKG